MARSAQAILAYHHAVRPACRQFLVTVLLICSACAHTSTRPIVRSADNTVPRPARILLYDFAFSVADVNEYQGIMRQQPSIRSPMQRQHDLGKAASEALALHLAANLRHLGFRVERVPRGTRASRTDLLIDGRFLSVDEGNPLRRLVIGFGAGASAMEIRVQVSGLSRKESIVEFTTRAESGRFPGAVATAPVGVTLPAAAGIGLAAGSAAANRIDADASGVTAMATANARQIARYLGLFFVEQRWLSSAQVEAVNDSR